MPSATNYTVRSDHSPKGRWNENKISMGPISTLCFCTVKETIHNERQPMNWEKIFAIDTNWQSLISKIYKQIAQHKKKTDVMLNQNQP